MKLTILGKYGPFPPAGGACSGYFVEEDDTRVLIDCGSGVLARLQQVCELQDLTAIVLSHLHNDHMSDMLVLKYALENLAARGVYQGTLSVYLPDEPSDVHKQVISSPHLQPIVITHNMTTTIGNLSFTFCEMTHSVQSFAMAVESNGKKLVYTGDSNMNEAIAKFSKSADLLVADTGLLDKDKKDNAAPHLTAEEVGEIAAKAGVKKLILSHIRPGYKEEDLVKEAARYYKNPMIAEEMKTYFV